MTPMEIIRQAYDHIKIPEQWCQGYYQRDKEGNMTGWRDSYSCCALGALNVPFKYLPVRPSEICYEENYSAEFIATCTLPRISERLFGKHIQQVNDDVNVDKNICHRNILKIYETAIEMFSDSEPTKEFWSRVENESKQNCASV